MDSPHIPAAIGVTGLLGTITLSDLNTVVAISVGLVTLCYLCLKIWKEFKFNE